MADESPISLEQIDRTGADATFMNGLKGAGSDAGRAEDFPPSGEKGWGRLASEPFPPSGEKGWGK